MTKTFLEKIGTLFASSVYIEGIIKDLIIFKEHPEFIEDFNSGNILEGLTEERKEAAKGSFNQDVVDKFVKLYNLDETSHKLYTVILLLRDIFGHSRIGIEEEKIWYCPQKPNKLKKIKDLFGMEGDGDTIIITDAELNFDGRIKMIQELDESNLRDLALTIGLDYARLR